jgi:prepilin-type N-terminal cleavage/methylation domain-containing protein
MTKAFTLIELLIVVAIIAILAAIAVPNFLEAQTRAKLARSRADMRTVAIALEAYRAESNAYPPNDGLYNVLPRQITTPVAFVATGLLVDPFSDKERHPVYGELARYYTYGKVVSRRQFPIEVQAGCAPAIEVLDMPGFNPGAFARYGDWRLVGNGPDRTYSSRAFLPVDPVLLGSDIPYDPSNGTVSWGNLLRTQR